MGKVMTINKPIDTKMICFYAWGRGALARNGFLQRKHKKVKITFLLLFITYYCTIM